jgi:hypothetical protein
MTASTSSVTPARTALAGPIAAGCSAIGAAVYVGAVDPSSAGAYPECVVRSVTGWWCPGCGLTRATHHLLHGDIWQAHAYNALVVPIMTLLVVAWIAWLMGSTGRRPAWVQRAVLPAWIGLGIAAVAFAIFRNLPFLPLLRG